MRVNMFIKKSIAGAIITAIIFVLLPFPTPTAHGAALDSGDSLSVPIKSFTEAAQKYVRTGISVYGVPIPFTSLDSIMKLLVKQIIEQLRKQVIKWVTQGNDGNPYFETNLNLFINETYDKTGKDYLNGLKKNSGTMCSYFKSEVINGISDYLDLATFDDSSNSTCQMERKIGKEKVKVFLDGNFSEGGGWESWYELTQNDDNNFWGTYLVERDRTLVAIQAQESIEREKLASQSQYHAKEDSDGNVITPAEVIKDQTNQALSSDLRQLEQAKTFDDFVTSLVSMYINKIITEGLKKGADSIDGDNNSSGSGSKKYAKPNYSQADDNTTTDDTQNTDAIQNVGINGKASQMSTWGEGRHDAQVALESPRVRDPEIGVSITEEETNPWWQVDLKKKYPIDHIDITPREDDEYGYDLISFYVIISENPITGNAIPSAGNGIWKSARISPSKPRTDITTITPPAGTVGQYVRIQVDTVSRGGGERRLEVAGVEIFAKNVPVLTLIGGSLITLPRNTAYEEPGVVAVDKNDGDISNKVVITGTVNSEVAGNYTLTYKITNSRGISVSLPRTVIIQ